MILSINLQTKALAKLIKTKVFDIFLERQTLIFKTNILIFLERFSKKVKVSLVKTCEHNC